MSDRADELAIYREKASSLLLALEPARRGRLLKRMAQTLRRSQQQRIAAQVGPDGSPWEKRKPRKEQKPASRAIRFLYRKGGGDVRMAEMRSWVGRGAYVTGYDKEAEGIRTFRRDRIARHLPVEGGADPGPIPGGLRGKGGGVRTKARAMFRGLRASGNLKAGASSDEAWVAFTSRASRIARIHHYGLRDKVAPDGPETRYPQRELLGFSQADEEALLDMLLEAVAEDV